MVSFPPISLIPLIFLLPAPVRLSLPFVSQIRPSRASPSPCHPPWRRVAPLSLPLRRVSLSLTPATVLRRPSRDEKQTQTSDSSPATQTSDSSPATPNGNTASISVFFFFFFLGLFCLFYLTSESSPATQGVLFSADPNRNKILRRPQTVIPLPSPFFFFFFFFWVYLVYLILL
jgi:hypothetical protein